MKIISGNLKGRKIDNYDIEGTRPTQDRVKESLFGIIQNKIKNSVFLDLFGGSGSIAFEAISNGAKKVYCIDKNRVCINNIKELSNKFNLDNIIIINSDYFVFLESCVKNSIYFDIIYIDPPYNMKIINNIIKYIIDNKLIFNNGLIIAETDDKYISDYEDFKIYKIKKYGSTYLTILKNTN